MVKRYAVLCFEIDKTNSLNVQNFYMRKSVFVAEVCVCVCVMCLKFHVYSL